MPIYIVREERYWNGLVGFGKIFIGWLGDRLLWRLEHLRWKKKEKQKSTSGWSAVPIKCLPISTQAVNPEPSTSKMQIIFSSLSLVMSKFSSPDKIWPRILGRVLLHHLIKEPFRIVFQLLIMLLQSINFSTIKKQCFLIFGKAQVKQARNKSTLPPLQSKCRSPFKIVSSVVLLLVSWCKKRLKHKESLGNERPELLRHQDARISVYVPCWEPYFLAETTKRSPFYFWQTQLVVSVIPHKPRDFGRNVFGIRIFT